MFVKAVNTYSLVLDSVPNRYKSEEMYDKAVDDNASALGSVPYQCKTYEM